MIGHGGGGGGGEGKGGNGVKMLKNNFYINLFGTFFVQIGKYQFTMACIRALVMIAYQVINCLISYSELFLYKPVGKYQFTMACIRALVMIAYQVINCLISQPKHMLWVLKRAVVMRRFF